MADEEEDTRVYIVLINAEEQYSLWPKEKKIPPGWQSVDKEGSKSDCMSYVDTVWTDMRPLSLRKKMDANLG
jgi:MbtH protein